jgi:hypothetical protein
MHHIREGKHGARSSKQAIAIGLSKARRAGVKLPTPRRGQASEETRAQAQRETARGARGHRPSPRRSRATTRALRREGSAAASPTALARHAKSAARRRGHADLRRAAKKAANTRARHIGKKSSRARRIGMSAR